MASWQPLPIHLQYSFLPIQKTLNFSKIPNRQCYSPASIFSNRLRSSSSSNSSSSICKLRAKKIHRRYHHHFSRLNYRLYHNSFSQSQCQQEGPFPTKCVVSSNLFSRSLSTMKCSTKSLYFKANRYNRLQYSCRVAAAYTWPFYLKASSGQNFNRNFSLSNIDPIDSSSAATLENSNAASDFTESKNKVLHISSQSLSQKKLTSATISSVIPTSSQSPAPSSSVTAAASSTKITSTTTTLSSSSSCTSLTEGVAPASSNPSSISTATSTTSLNIPSSTTTTVTTSKTASLLSSNLSSATIIPSSRIFPSSSEKLTVTTTIANIIPSLTISHASVDKKNNRNNSNDSNINSFSNSNEEKQIKSVYKQNEVIDKKLLKAHSNDSNNISASDPEIIINNETFPKGFPRGTEEGNQTLVTKENEFKETSEKLLHKKESKVNWNNDFNAKDDQHNKFTIADYINRLPDIGRNDNPESKFSKLTTVSSSSISTTLTIYNKTLPDVLPLLSDKIKEILSIIENKKTPDKFHDKLSQILSQKKNGSQSRRILHKLSEASSSDKQAVARVCLFTILELKVKDLALMDFAPLLVADTENESETRDPFSTLKDNPIFVTTSHISSLLQEMVHQRYIDLKDWEGILLAMYTLFPANGLNPRKSKSAVMLSMAAPFVKYVDSRPLKKRPSYQLDSLLISMIVDSMSQLPHLKLYKEISFETGVLNLVSDDDLYGLFLQHCSLSVSLESLENLVVHLKHRAMVMKPEDVVDIIAFFTRSLCKPSQSSSSSFSRINYLSNTLYALSHYDILPSISEVKMSGHFYSYSSNLALAFLVILRHGSCIDLPVMLFDEMVERVKNSNSKGTTKANGGLTDNPKTNQLNDVCNDNGLYNDDHTAAVDLLVEPAVSTCNSTTSKLYNSESSPESKLLQLPYIRSSLLAGMTSLNGKKPKLLSQSPEIMSLFLTNENPINSFLLVKEFEILEEMSKKFQDPVLGLAENFGKFINTTGNFYLFRQITCDHLISVCSHDAKMMKLESLEKVSTFNLFSFEELVDYSWLYLLGLEYHRLHENMAPTKEGMAILGGGDTLIKDFFVLLRSLSVPIQSHVLVIAHNLYDIGLCISANHNGDYLEAFDTSLPSSTDEKDLWSKHISKMDLGYTSSLQLLEDHYQEVFPSGSFYRNFQSVPLADYMQDIWQSFLTDITAESQMLTDKQAKAGYCSPLLFNILIYDRTFSEKPFKKEEVGPNFLASQQQRTLQKKFSQRLLQQLRSFQTDPCIDSAIMDIAIVGYVIDHYKLNSEVLAELVASSMTKAQKRLLFPLSRRKFGPSQFSLWAKALQKCFVNKDLGIATSIFDLIPNVEDSHYLFVFSNAHYNSFYIFFTKHLGFSESQVRIDVQKALCYFALHEDIISFHSLAQFYHTKQNYLDRSNFGEDAVLPLLRESVVEAHLKMCNLERAAEILSTERYHELLWCTLAVHKQVEIFSEPSFLKIALNYAEHHLTDRNYEAIRKLVVMILGMDAPKLALTVYKMLVGKRVNHDPVLHKSVAKDFKKILESCRKVVDGESAFELIQFAEKITSSSSLPSSSFLVDPAGYQLAVEVCASAHKWNYALMVMESMKKQKIDFDANRAKVIYSSLLGNENE